MKVLHLTLKKKWFDMIASGEKKEEYREIKDYWSQRLISDYSPIYGFNKRLPSFKQYDLIEFKNGYSVNSPLITVECKGIRIGNVKPEWSDNFKDECFIIKLGDIIK